MQGTFSSESLEIFSQLASYMLSEDFKESPTYDFTRCVRPDGSVYGTKGQCRKGAETSAKEKTQTGMRIGKTVRSMSKEELEKLLKDPRLKPHQVDKVKELIAGAAAKKPEEPKKRDLVALDKEWEAKRLKTYNSLKGKSKEELLSILNNKQKIHGMSVKDTIRDLKGGILNAIHGSYSPSDSAKKYARLTARAKAKRENGEERREAEEKPKRQMSGQQLANAMARSLQIENSVRANNKGSLMSKKAKAQLKAALDAENLPSKEEMRAMLIAQRAADIRAEMKS